MPYVVMINRECFYKISETMHNKAVHINIL